MRELLASERGGLLEQQQEMLPFLTFLCWVAIRTSCPSCSPKGNPWTYRILTLIFNCTHRLSCLDSKQKSYKILVNATNCVKFWRGEGINMTVEEMKLLCTCFVLSRYSHTWNLFYFLFVTCGWVLMAVHGCPSYLLLPQSCQSEDEGKMKALSSEHTLLQKRW